MKCIKCESEKFVRNGRSANGKQTYKCKSCGRRFLKDYSAHSWQVSDQIIITLVKEGCGIRSTARILRISPTTLISRIKAIAMKLKRPFPVLRGKSYEIDEMSTFIRRKKQKVWITYALRRDNKEVIEFTVGTRSKSSMRKVTDTVILSDPESIHTDQYKNYVTLIPEQLHSVRRRCTNRIERMNLNLRTHLKRLNRRTICYSKSLVMLSACLKIWFWG